MTDLLIAFAAVLLVALPALIVLIWRAMDVAFRRQGEHIERMLRLLEPIGPLATRYAELQGELQAFERGVRARLAAVEASVGELARQLRPQAPDVVAAAPADISPAGADRVRDIVAAFAALADADADAAFVARFDAQPLGADLRRNPATPRYWWLAVDDDDRGIVLPTGDNARRWRDPGTLAARRPELAPVYAVEPGARFALVAPAWGHGVGSGIAIDRVGRLAGG